MMMNETIQQMLMSDGGLNGMDNMTERNMQELQQAMNMNNMTDSDLLELQHKMNMQICFPMMDEKMMEGMMGMMGQ
jgi:phosphoserine aminotransferase